MLYHISKFSNAKTNSTLLLAAATAICLGSVEGLSRDQARIMLASVENISTDAIEIDKVIQVIRSTSFT